MFSEWKLGVFSFFFSGSILFPTAVFRTLMLMILVGEVWMGRSVFVFFSGMDTNGSMVTWSLSALPRENSACMRLAACKTLLELHSNTVLQGEMRQSHGIALS